ncbi:hypothetical protein MKX01_020678 [Papaver californicum]|nr:hypothetical protein MKX01_020678 [Papaver californicum]
MEDIHEDIQSKILSHVPSESVLNCKLVCKRWRLLLSNRKVSLGVLFSISSSLEHMIHLYYADYGVIKSTECQEDFYNTKIAKINLPPIKEERERKEVIVGSCNGLVCLAIPHKGVYNPVYICNPFTGEYTILPRISNNKSWDVVSGFGYLPCTNEYKVVRILYPADSIHNPTSTTTKGCVQVYTLGKGSSSGWRNITETTYSLYSQGIFANGSLYWKHDKNDDIIVAFDLADEKFRVLPPPPCLRFPRDEDKTMCLTMLGGYLCLVDHPAYETLDIWSFRKNTHQANRSSYDVIEQDYYHDWSWSKDFSIEWERDGRRLYLPFALTKSNEVLLWSESTLKCYDPVTKSLNVIVKGDLVFETFQGILHMNSLVSLKDLGVPSKMWVGWVSKKTQPSQEK